MLAYIRQTENLRNDESFEKKTEKLVTRLRKIQLRLKQSDDFYPLQRQLALIVDGIRLIKTGYTSRICDCSREIQSTLGSNAAWAAVSIFKAV